MMTVHEVSSISGVSIRTLHHYDSIGLLPPSAVTEAGYRLYDDTALERLQLILLFRELEFPLKEIREILDSPAFDRDRALAQQIHLLELRREHLDNLIDLARGIKTIGVDTVNRIGFEAFDTRKIDEYARQAKEAYGQTAAYKEYEEKSQGRSKETQQKLNGELMAIFRAFGDIRDQSPDGEAAIALVKRLQAHITANYYTCTDEILSSLGAMYGGGGDFTVNIDRAGGEGTAIFAQRAIEAYVASRQ